MGHFKKLFDQKYVGSWDLEGHPSVSVTIGKVELEEMRSPKGSTVKKPVLYFIGSAKGLVLNTTNATIIANTHGNNTDAWPGKKLIMFATRCPAFGSWEDCIRIQGWIMINRKRIDYKPGMDKVPQ